MIPFPKTTSPHLIAEPSALDFGELLGGQAGQQTLRLTNASGLPLTLVIDVTPPFQLQSSSDVFLPASGWTDVTVRVSSLVAGDLEGSLIVLSQHDGVRTPLEEQVTLSAQVRIPAELSFSFPDYARSDVSDFGFGYVSARQYSKVDLEGVPMLKVLITNTGTWGVAATARNVTVIPQAGSQQQYPKVGKCGFFANGEICIADASGDPPVLDLGPGESAETYWRVYPWDSGWFNGDFLATGTGVAEKTLKLTGALVPTGIGSGPFLGADGSETFAKAAGDYQTFGRSTDPIGQDTIGDFVPAGIDPRAAFDIGTPDLVEARTGNVVLPIPLGGPQPVRNGLAWELTAVVNGRIWNREPNFGFPVEIQFPEIEDRFDQQILDKLELLFTEYPNPAYNATIGVSLHMGMLIPPSHINSTAGLTFDLNPNTSDDILQYEHQINSGPRWVYVDASGNQHAFFHGLHGDEVASEPYDTASVGYTRDGSHLRFVRETLTNFERVAWIEFPNGQRHMFRDRGGNSDDWSPTLKNRWQLSRIEDRDGNAVVITYNDTLFTWTIRGATVARNVPNDFGTITYLDWRKTVVQFTGDGRPLTVTHLGVGNSAAEQRVFTLGYSVATIDRPARSAFHTVLQTYDPTLDTSLTVRPLTQITNPDGTTWDFDWTTTNDDIWLGGYTHVNGAAIEYDWDSVWSTTRDCSNRGQAQAHQGVVQRTVKDIGDGTIGNTKYLRQHIRPASISDADAEAICKEFARDYSNGLPRAEHKVAVWTELNDRAGKHLSSVDVSYYSNYPFPAISSAVPAEMNPDGWQHLEKNLPLTRRVSDGDGRFLSKELWKCDVIFSDAPTIGFDLEAILANQVGDRIEDLLTQCEPLKTVFARYEVEKRGDCSAELPDCLLGSRIVDSRTEFHTDKPKETPANPNPDPRWIRVQHSNYDGLGNYRQTDVTSNFPDLPGTWVNTTFRDHNPGEGTLSLDRVDYSVLDSYTPPSNWVLIDSGEWWTQQNGALASRRGGESVFDANGRLRLRRTWTGSSAGSTDIVVLNNYSQPHHELTLQRFFGADAYPGPGGNSSCTGSGVPTSATWQDWTHTSHWNANCQDYAVQLTYSAGVLAQQHIDGEDLYQVNRVIDPYTGWVTADILNSGETVSKSYTKSGRLASITRPYASSTVLDYTKPTATSGWIMTAESYGAGAPAGTPINFYTGTYDGLGRLIKESVPTWDYSTTSNLAERQYQFHVGGPLRRFSSIDSASKWTTFEYDAENRLRTRTNPGPDKSRVVNEYQGDRKVVVKNWVATYDLRDSADDHAEAKTVLTYDPLGRVTKAELPAGGFTAFQYDALGQVTQASRGTQIRLYGFDGRGFPTFEAIPEKKRRVGLGTEQIATRFSDYDTQGNAHVIKELVRNANGSFGTVHRTTSLEIDPQGRPLSIEVDGRVMKSFIYDQLSGTATSSGGANLSKCEVDSAQGQLVKAVRHNYLGDDVWNVYSGFCYDQAGRSDRRETRVTKLPSGGSESGTTFTQSWSYNDLGVTTQDIYPYVTQGCGGCTDARSIRTVNYQLRQGRYTKRLSVPNVTNQGADFTYHRSGRLNSVDHFGTAGSDVYGADDSGLNRVGSISLAGGLLDLGNVEYDQSGNIRKIGAATEDGDRFYYDVNSRLKVADLDSTALDFTFEMDQYDNITTLGTIDTLNNRMTGTEFTYDLYGSMTKLPSVWLATYDDLDKLQKITAGGSVQTSVYDHNDLRVLRAEGTAVRWFLRDQGGRVIRELSGLGALSLEEENFYAAGRLVSSRKPGGVQNHYHTDHLGSTRFMTTQGVENTGEEQEFTPYGMQLQGPVGGAEGRAAAGFAGHEQPDNPWTTYMRGRTYTQQHARFMQIDPARSGWNAYAYSALNPVTRIDPTGFSDEDAGDEEDGEEFNAQGMIIISDHGYRANGGGTIPGTFEAKEGTKVYFLTSAGDNPEIYRKYAVLDDSLANRIEKGETVVLPPGQLSVQEGTIQNQLFMGSGGAGLRIGGSPDTAIYTPDIPMTLQEIEASLPAGSCIVVAACGGILSNSGYEDFLFRHGQDKGSLARYFAGDPFLPSNDINKNLPKEYLE